MKPVQRVRTFAEASRAFCLRLMTARPTDDRGASLVEYALLVALIAVVCIGAISAIGSSASAKFSSVGSSLAK